MALNRHQELGIVELTNIFLVNGFPKCPYEHAPYCKVHKNRDILIFYLYVDDLIFTGNNPSMFEDFKK